MASGKRSWWAQRPGETEKAHNKRLGCAVWAVLLILLAIVIGVCSAVTNHSSGDGSSGGSSIWTYERSKLAGHLSDWQTAQRAGNIPHAEQLQEQILKDCQTDAALTPDTSVDHDAVKSACASVGVSVP